ncbi:hypothetical protein [Shinella sedimenti]|uniref:Uncharacterized protein n=1 Tax=Shinella sedimenti TaxID=2919913 RepID=A0ABT0CT42_9HYPH|nr:hypothetical protein [Shinella sedimenti]MCJ8151777.1 hypothetical protein [Shinella sedimenti]
MKPVQKQFLASALAGRERIEVVERNKFARIYQRRGVNVYRVPTYAVVLFGFFGFSQFATAADPCAGVDRSLTKQNKAEYAMLIAKSLDRKVKPASVEIDAALRYETWAVIYASTPVGDPGYFFFDSSSGAPVFKDVWGGMADDGDGPVLIKWARKLGANKEIASCFSHVVMSD